MYLIAVILGFLEYIPKLSLPLHSVSVPVFTVCLIKLELIMMIRVKQRWKKETDTKREDMKDEKKEKRTGTTGTKQNRHRESKCQASHIFEKKAKCIYHFL